MTSVLNVDTIADKAGTGPVALTKQSAAKSYLTYDQTVPEVDGSLNVSSVTDHSAGAFTVNFQNSMNNTTYSWFTGGQDGRVTGVNTGTVPTTSAIKYFTRITNTLGLVDVNLNTAGIHGDLA